jgi:hypothetical protein
VGCCRLDRSVPTFLWFHQATRNQFKCQLRGESYGVYTVCRVRVVEMVVSQITHKSDDGLNIVVETEPDKTLFLSRVDLWLLVRRWSPCSLILLRDIIGRRLNRNALIFISLFIRQSPYMLEMTKPVPVDDWMRPDDEPSIRTTPSRLLRSRRSTSRK